MPSFTSKPELHESTMRLVARVAKVHDEGSGKIPLMELLRMLPYPLEAGDDAQASRRGDLVFTRLNERHGTFRNEGEPLEFATELFTITVPPLVSGTYLSLPDQFHCCFNEGQTLCARMLFFLVAKLEKIQVDENRIDIKCSQKSFDQHIFHHPVTALLAQLEHSAAAPPPFPPGSGMTLGEISA